MNRVALLAIGVLLVAAAQAACGGGGGSPTAPEGLMSEAAGSISATAAESLSADTDESRHTAYVLDFAAVRDALGLATPTSLEEWIEQWQAFTDAGVGGPSTTWAFQNAFLAFSDEMLASYGIEPWRFEWIVEAGSPPRAISVAGGEFDRARISGLLRACEGCVEPPVATTHGGTEVLRWGEDFEQDFSRRLQPPLFDELGRGSAVAVTDSLLFRALSLRDLASSLDAREGGEARLGDIELFALMAAALDEAGAFTAMLTDDVESQRVEASNDPVLRPYRALGIGQGMAEGELFMVLVLVHETTEAAEENERRIVERIAAGDSLRALAPWSDEFPDVRVTRSGPVTTAVLRGPGARIGTGFYLVRDPLLGFSDNP